MGMDPLLLSGFQAIEIAEVFFRIKQRNLLHLVIGKTDEPADIMNFHAVPPLILTAYCSGLRSGSLQGKYLRFGNDLFDFLDKMWVACKQQYLMGVTQFAQRLERGAAAIGIEVHEDVIEDHRQTIDVVCIFANQSQPHRQVQLLRRTTAQHLRRKPGAIATFYLDFASVQRRYDP